MRKILLSLLGLLLLSEAAWGYLADQNLMVVSGKDAALTEGDMYHRAIYDIAAPRSLSGPIYIRIFDADLAGAHDQWADGSEVVYRLYGKGHLDRDLRAIDDPLPAGEPLAELRLGESKYYDDRWRTIAAVETSAGEPDGDSVWFQLVVDGARGRASNLYQVFVSAAEKDNRPVDGLRLFSPVVTLRLPPATNMRTQIHVPIPHDAEALTVFNFDVDEMHAEATLLFETPFGPAVPLTSSKDGQVSRTEVALQPDDRGKTGAIVLANDQQANYVQLWVVDDRGRVVPLRLPVLFAPENHRPVPDFNVVPLAECFTVMLDASQSSDPDGDEMDVQWILPDGAQAQGRRVIHDFQRPGRYDVTLIVRDDSGFIANSARLTRTIPINEPPRAAITAPEKGVPGKALVFDGSKSRDNDGAILHYRWNFGDGATAQGQTVEHAYARSGKYNVTLHIEDDSQSLCNQGKTEQWIWINTPPVPRLTVKRIGAVGEVIALDAQGSVDSDGEIIRYAWDFGDQATAEGETVTHHWQQPGTYTVRLTVTDDAGLSNSSTQETADIVINAPPVALTTQRAVIAAHEDVVFDGTLSHDPDGSIRQYVWQMGDGAVKEGAQIRHAYAQPGAYSGRLTVTDDSGALNNTAVATFTVRVNAPPLAVAGADQIVNQSEVFFDASASTDHDDPIIGYTWDFGDGRQADGMKVSHVYALPGTYRVTLTVTDGSGTQTARHSDALEVAINYPPIADAGVAQVVSAGETVTFDGSFSEDPDGTLVAYRWSVAAGVTLSGQRVTYQYPTPGRHQIGLTVTDNLGAEHTDYTTVTVNAPPVADFFALPRVAPGQTLLFDGSCAYDPDGQIAHAWWDFGDGSPVQEGLAVHHAFASAGRYAVTLTVRDDSPATENTAAITRMVEVNYPPQADAGKDIRACTQHVRFDASQSADPDGDALSYAWDFGDGASGRGRMIEHTYAQPGIYPVRLTVDDGQGLDNSTAHAQIIAHVNAPPAAVLQIGSAKVCAGELVLFDASQSTDPERGLLRYVWDLGDGVPIEGINPVRSYTQGGAYRIRLVVSDDSNLRCNSGEAEAILHVIDAPIARAGDDHTACANTPVQFDGAASTGGGRRIKSYEWDFGDDQSGVGVNPVHLYSQPGEYPVRLVLTVSGESQCQDVSEDELLMTILAAPVASFTARKAACAGETVQFDASASSASDGQITEYLWDFGDGASASGKQSPHAYQTPGTYTVTLRIHTDSQERCNTAVFSETIAINASPTAAIQVTAGDAAFFSGAMYETDPQTWLRFSGAQSADPDGYLQSYRWDFGDEHQATGTFAAHQYQHPGDYQVRLQVQDNSATACNLSDANLLVRVRRPIAPEITGPTVVCAGQAAEYRVDSDDRSLTWNFSDNTTATGTHAIKTFAAAGQYQIQVQAGDAWFAAHDVTVRTLPEITVPKELEIFLGDTLTIQPVYRRSALPLVWQWDLGDGTILATEQLTHTYQQSGNQTVHLRLAFEDGPECLHAHYQIPVRVQAPPEVEIRTTPEPIYTGGARDEVIFEASPGDDPASWNYRWDFGDGNTAIGRHVSHAYQEPGTFQVTVTLSDTRHRTSQVFTGSTTITVKRRM